MTEGAELLRCALEAGAPVESIYVAPAGDGDPATQDVCRRAAAAGVRVFPLAAGVLERVADTVTPQPVLAVVPMLDDVASATVSAGPGSLVIVLVDVRDPGNAGTVLRAADAAGAGAVVFAGESVDPYNPKTVRSSAGSLFHVPFSVRDDAAALAADLAEAGYRTLATVVRDGDDYAGLDWSVPTAVFFGNESSGLDLGLAAELDGTVAIPDGGPGGVAQRGRGQCGRRFEAFRQRRGGSAGARSISGNVDESTW